MKTKHKRVINGSFIARNVYGAVRGFTHVLVKFAKALTRTVSEEVAGGNWLHITALLPYWTAIAPESAIMSVQMDRGQCINCKTVS